MNITIAGHSFAVPEGVLAKYHVGATIHLDEGTASTLQQATCENLRNNFASKVKKEIAGAEPTQDQLAKLQEEFNAYAASYSFGVRQTRERIIVDPVEKEARKLIATDILAAFKAKYNEKLDKERLAVAVDTVLEKKGDDYLKRARVIVRERNKVAESVLEGVEGL